MPDWITKHNKEICISIRIIKPYTMNVEHISVHKDWIRFIIIYVKKCKTITYKYLLQKIQSNIFVCTVILTQLFKIIEK